MKQTTAPDAVAGPVKRDASHPNARSKIAGVEALAPIVAALRREGRKVVLAHGVFDLVHLGHVRHLEEARRHGDVLIVTVTADRFVNKGPGRPVFSARLRAEMVAALEPVTWVAISEHPSAVPILNALQPDIYVKGSDYADAADDVTGGIIHERAAVEAHGGRILFTDDITFSSSSLINRYLGGADPRLQVYLEGRRADDILGSLLALLDQVADFRVLLVGDTIIDEYVYVDPLGKSPKETMIATLYRDRESFAGGVIAAANHVASLCREVDVITALGAGGDAAADEALVRASLKPNVRLSAIRRADKPTTRKTRFIDQDDLRKLFELYTMDDAPLDAAEEAACTGLIAERAGDFDLVIVTDFGHGLITEAGIESLTRHARFLAVNAQTNSANRGFNLVTRYPRADYVCIDAPEARLACAEKSCEIAELAAQKLPARIACSRLILTHGKHGCVTFDQQAGLHRIPAFTNTVVDTVGAGDAFLAVTAPLVATGAPLDLVGFVGNAVGALKVGIVGHRRSIEKIPLIKFMTAILK